MKNWKAIAAVLLVFILGAFCGGVVTHMVHRSRMEAFVGGGPVAREELLVKRLTRQLDLDTRQLELIKPIVHETHANISRVHQLSRPQVEVLLEESQRQISAVLRPEQREKFEKIIADRKKHRPLRGEH
jgi:hypothetical protein